MLRPSLSALQSPSPSFTGSLPLGLANGILRIANGNVEHLLGKQNGIARTFGHEASMPQAPPSLTPKFKLRHYPTFTWLHFASALVLSFLRP
jgi:hypothetical protein